VNIREYSSAPDTLSDVRADLGYSPIKSDFPADFGLFWSEITVFGICFADELRILVSTEAWIRGPGYGDLGLSGICFVYELRILMSTAVNQPRPLIRANQSLMRSREASSTIDDEHKDEYHATETQLHLQKTCESVQQPSYAVKGYSETKR
jgi:hypothetical protein